MAVEVFVDTSAWYPLAVGRHPDHAAVGDALRDRVRHGARVVTTNLVVAETHALLLRRAGRQAGLGFVRRIGGPPNVVVSSTVALEAIALSDWLEHDDDHDFSLTDAVSFAVMTERGIGEALTLDHHFAAAGFRTVP